jgi:hypothetical protein
MDLCDKAGRGADPAESVGVRSDNPDAEVFLMCGVHVSVEFFPRSKADATAETVCLGTATAEERSKRQVVFLLHGFVEVCPSV